MLQNESENPCSSTANMIKPGMSSLTNEREWERNDNANTFTIPSQAEHVFHFPSAKLRNDAEDKRKLEEHNEVLYEKVKVLTELLGGTGSTNTKDHKDRFVMHPWLKYFKDSAAEEVFCEQYFDEKLTGRLLLKLCVLQAGLAVLKKVTEEAHLGNSIILGGVAIQTTILLLLAGFLLCLLLYFAIVGKFLPNSHRRQHLLLLWAIGFLGLLCFAEPENPANLVMMLIAVFKSLSCNLSLLVKYQSLLLLSTFVMLMVAVKVLPKRGEHFNTSPETVSHNHTAPNVMSWTDGHLVMLVLSYAVGSIANLNSQRISEFGKRRHFTFLYSFARSWRNQMHLLQKFLPPWVAEKVKLESPNGALRSHSKVVVLFCTIKNVNELQSKLGDEGAFDKLHELMYAWDQKIKAFQTLYKVENINSDYVIAGGIVAKRDPEAIDTHDYHVRTMQEMIKMSQEMIRIASKFSLPHEMKFKVRVGINVGPLIAGVIGQSRTFFRLFGDTMNTASRMQSHGADDRITMTEAAALLCKEGGYEVEQMPDILVKGKGMMKTFRLKQERTGDQNGGGTNTKIHQVEFKQIRNGRGTSSRLSLKIPLETHIDVKTKVENKSARGSAQHSGNTSSDASILKNQKRVSELKSALRDAQQFQSDVELRHRIKDFFYTWKSLRNARVFRMVNTGFIPIGIAFIVFYVAIIQPNHPIPLRFRALPDMFMILTMTTSMFGIWFVKANPIRTFRIDSAGRKQEIKLTAQVVAICVWERIPISYPTRTISKVNHGLCLCQYFILFWLSMAYLVFPDSSLVVLWFSIFVGETYVSSPQHARVYLPATVATLAAVLFVQPYLAHEHWSFNVEEYAFLNASLGDRLVIVILCLFMLENIYNGIVVDYNTLQHEFEMRTKNTLEESTTTNILAGLLSKIVLTKVKTKQVKPGIQRQHSRLSKVPRAISRKIKIAPSKSFRESINSIDKVLAQPSNTDLVLNAEKHFVVALFCDLVGFTSLSEKLDPMELAQTLSRLYSAFDSIVSRRSLHKVDTIGDAYILLAGLGDKPANGNIQSVRDLDPSEIQHWEEMASTVVDCGLEMLSTLHSVTQSKECSNLSMRVGVHVGSVVGGFLGCIRPRFQVFGSGVIIAEQLESSSPPGKVHVSSEVAKLISKTFALIPHRNAGVDIPTFQDLTTHGHDDDDNFEPLRSKSIGQETKEITKYSYEFNTDTTFVVQGRRNHQVTVEYMLKELDRLRREHVQQMGQLRIELMEFIQSQLK